MLTWAMEGNYVDGGLGALWRRDLGSVLCLGFVGVGRDVRDYLGLGELTLVIESAG